MLPRLFRRPLKKLIEEWHHVLPTQSVCLRVPLDYPRPQRLLPAQGALRKAAEAPEWKSDLEKNVWSDDFTTGEAFRKELDKDYAGMKAVLVDIGLAK